MRSSPGGNPAIRGVLILHDLETGAPLAVLESSYLTALRTGLAGALGSGCAGAARRALRGDYRSRRSSTLSVGRFAPGAGDNIGADLRFFFRSGPAIFARYRVCRSERGCGGF